MSSRQLLPYRQVLNPTDIPATDDFWKLVNFSPRLKSIYETTTMLITYNARLYVIGDQAGKGMGHYLGAGLVINPELDDFTYGGITEEVEAKRSVGGQVKWHGSTHSSVTQDEDVSADIYTQGNSYDNNYKTTLKGTDRSTGKIADYAVVSHNQFVALDDYAAVVLALIATLPSKGRQEAFTAFQNRQITKDKTHARVKKEQAIAKAKKEAEEAKLAEQRAARRERKQANTVQANTANEGEDDLIGP